MTLARALRAAVVGVIVAGCSYDWSIGSGSVADLPPIFDVDAGGAPAPKEDGGAPADAGADVDVDTDSGTTGGECGARCTCEGVARCRFTCTESPCTLDCKDKSDCALACAAGAQCNVACADDAVCDMDCSAGGSICKLSCEDDARCGGECRSGSICTRRCSRTCDIDCSGGGICP